MANEKPQLAKPPQEARPISHFRWEAALAALAGMGGIILSAPEQEIARRALNIGEAMERDARARGIIR